MDSLATNMVIYGISFSLFVGLIIWFFISKTIAKEYFEENKEEIDTNVLKQSQETAKKVKENKQQFLEELELLKEEEEFDVVKAAIIAAEIFDTDHTSQNIKEEFEKNNEKNVNAEILGIIFENSEDIILNIKNLTDQDTNYSSDNSSSSSKTSYDSELDD
jgi:uncharacterized protein YneF (UPF0154 family)